MPGYEWVRFFFSLRIAPFIHSSLIAHTFASKGQLGELMNDLDKALYCYDNVLRHNPFHVKALNQVASICRTREQYPKVPQPQICSRSKLSMIEPSQPRSSLGSRVFSAYLKHRVE